MKRFELFLLVFAILAFNSMLAAQKSGPPVPIFAVVNDGKQIEPIAFVQNGKLVPLFDENGKPTGGEDFIKRLYKPKTRYNLIFGGKAVGTVNVIKDLADTECARNQAEISFQSTRVTPKGFLMALATSAVPKKSVKGIRQLPTWPERAAINELVFEAFKSERVPIKNSGELRYHNLTKIDADSDGRFEFVGTYWYNTGAKVRSLLFFIAEQDAKGKISISFKEFGELKEDGVMSGDIKDIDNGIYHELLVDMFDYDGDGTSEIFTMSQAFEGSNFFVYKREKGVWTQVLNTSNYHCAY